MDVPKIFGRYQPINVLGTGGGSRVMLVKDLLNGETRALKVLLDEAGAEGFVREYELLASLDHPQVVKVFDFGQDASGLRYFTMEYLQGRPLSRVVQEEPEPLLVLQIAQQLLEVLAALHARGILHADLKPLNIYLEGDEGHEQVKLLDFGLAAVRRDKGSGNRRGTLSYMAPEWFQNTEVDFRSDLYSVGVLLFELLVGKPPYSEESAQALIQQKISKDAPDITTLRKDIPASLARLIQKLLEREPALRPLNAAEALLVLTEQRGARSNIIHLSTLPLMGRERLMAVSRGVLETVVTSASGHFQLLVGDGGSGKTRILRELRNMVQREGHKIIETSAHDVDGRSALEQLLYLPLVVDRELNRQLIQRYESSLEGFMRTTTGRASAPHLRMTPEQRISFADSIASFLVEVASRRPLVVLIDDLQEIDPFVQDLVERMGQRISTAPLLMFATVERDFLTAHEGFNELTSRSDVDVATLDPVTQDEIGELLHEMFGQLPNSALLSRLLKETTAGNPAMLSEYLESLLFSEVLRLEGGRWLLSDTGAQELLAGSSTQNRTELLLQRRLAPLTPVERGLIEAAAVLGRELNEDALVRLVQGATWAQDCLESLIRRGLLQRDAEELDRLRFCQPRLQTYLLGQIPVEQVRALHRLAAQQHLASCGPSIPEPSALADHDLLVLAHHFLAAMDLETGRSFGVAAADRAERINNTPLALELYKKLLALAQFHGLPSPLDVELRIAELTIFMGQLDVGRQLLEALREQKPRPSEPWLAAQEPNLPLPVKLAIQLASIYRFQAKGKPAFALMRSVIHYMDETDDIVTKAHILDQTLRCAMLDYDKEVTPLWIVKGLELIKDFNLPRLMPFRLRFLCYQSGAHLNKGELNLMEPYVREALGLIESNAKDSSLQQSREYLQAVEDVYLMANNLELHRERPTEGLRYLHAGLEVATRLHDLQMMMKFCINLAHLLSPLGQWAEAIEHSEAGLDIAMRLKAERMQVVALSNLAFLYKDVGQLEKALRFAEHAVRLVNKLDYRYYKSAAIGNLGEVRARMGQTAEALHLYEQSLQHATDVYFPSEMTEGHRRIAELCLEEGKLTRARKEIHEGLELARKYDVKTEEARLLTLQGWEAAQRNLTDRALSSFRQAEEILKESTSEFERARLKFRQGQAFIRLGFPSEAETSLRMAEEIFRRYGAVFELKHTREALARLGGENAGNALAFRKLQLLLDVTRTIGSELDLETLLGRLLDKALELTQTERGYMILLDERGEPTFYATRHMARDEVEKGETAQFSSTIIRRVATEGRALAITNIDQSTDLRTQASIVALGLRSIICAPIKRGERMLGVIYVDSSRVTESFYHADISLLEALADAAAISLENARLVTALRRKSDLMSIMAHEIRSPLAASISFTHQLQRSSEGLTEDQRDGIESILEQGYRLNRMINNILELARMEANRVEWYMEEVRLGEILGTTVRGLEPLAREKNVRISLVPVPEEAQCLANPDRLIQVCTNLLSNALKFTPDRGEVQLSVEVLELARPLITRGGRATAGESWGISNVPAQRKLSENKWLMVRFADTGPGIPVEDLERIFGQFNQSGPAHMRGQGTGLGLTIAREIVAQHGGRLWAENAPSGGAMFVFSLPLLVPGP